MMRPILGFGILVLLVLALPASGAAGSGEDLSQGMSMTNAYELVLSRVLDGSLEGKAVYVSIEPVKAGTMAETWQAPISLPREDGWFFLIDDHPLANWAHPCRYAFVGMSGEITVYDAWSPPENIELGGINPGSASPEELERSGESPMGSPGRSMGLFQAGLCPDTGHCYAFIISGGSTPLINWPRYWEDVSNMYKTLTQEYGYEKDHIYVLMSDGTDPGADQNVGSKTSPVYVDSDNDLDGDGNNEVNGAADRANITATFNTLSGLVGNHDYLFIFTTDHGSNDTVPYSNQAELTLWHEAIEDQDFNTELNKISSDSEAIIITMEQCFSGGFVDDLITGYSGPQRRVLATAANADEYSWGRTFSDLWISAVRGSRDNGDPVDADTDNDGHVSMSEAFTYASTNDGEPEHPQYAETSAGLGSGLYLNSCSLNVIADAGADQTVEQTGLAGTPVTLDGSGSYDPDCDDDLTYAWTWAGGAATGVSPTITLPLGTTTITLTAADGSLVSEPDTVEVTVEDTTPPVLTVPDDITVEQEALAGTAVTIPPAAATDICDAGPAVSDDAPPVFPLGTTTVTFTATDASGNEATGSMKVTVVDTTPPVLSVPDAVTVEQETRDGTVVPLLATATDTCDAAPVITNDAPAIFPLGTTTVTFTATDASGNSASGTVEVTVIDTTPPDISVAVSPDTLWSPNHKMEAITAMVTVTDICDAAPGVVLASLTSNEPDDAVGNGDGNTVNDIQDAATGSPDFAFLLRAERAGKGTGRIYTITYTATDASGNSASATAMVMVPHNEE